MSDTAAFCAKCGAKHAAGLEVKPTPRKGLKACRECGHEVSAAARACPNCGARNPGFGKKTYGVFSLVAFGVALVVFIALLRAFESGGPSVSESDVTSTAPAISVTADQLAGDYEANEVAADEKYKQKIVEVSGNVDSIGKDITDTIYVTLQTSEEYAVVKPQLFFSDEHKQEAAALQRGQPLTVKCRCDGKFMNVILKACVVERSPSASIEPNSALSATAPTKASASSAETSAPGGALSESEYHKKYDGALAKIGTNLQELGAARLARAEESDERAAKQQALVEGTADKSVGCEVWSSMATTTTPDMDNVCKHERGVMNSLPRKTRVAIKRQLVVVRMALGEGRYPPPAH
jgi:hypothetical protein